MNNSAVVGVTTRYPTLKSFSIDTDTSKNGTISLLDSLLGEIIQLKEDGNLPLTFTHSRNKRKVHLVKVPHNSSDKSFKTGVAKDDWIETAIRINSGSDINAGVRRILSHLLLKHERFMAQEFDELGITTNTVMDEYNIGALLKLTGIGPTRWRKL